MKTLTVAETLAQRAAETCAQRHFVPKHVSCEECTAAAIEKAMNGARAR